MALSACGGASDESTPSPGTSSGPTSASLLPAPTATNSDTTAPGLTSGAPNCALTYDLGSEPLSSGPDPLVSNAWHLKNTGQFNGLPGEDLNVESAWAISLGSSVTIALVDDAFETIHSDLGSNILASKGLDYRNRTSESEPPSVGSGLPCKASENHGTTVAGIIAAGYRNSKGSAGVAPNAKMVGYSAIETQFEDAAVDALTRDLQSNDIYNNSWGAPDDGELSSADRGFDQAIDKGIREGRKGLGSIYVFPSGNGGCALFDSLGRCQTELSSYDGYLNEMGLVVVSATDHFGRRPYYSEPGANVLVSAPGGSVGAGITSTTLGNKYSSSFYGTSAAAPMVSGVVALMLSANPSLSWRDVRLILARSARQNDRANLQWQAPAANGGYRFNPFYGFGAVDAAAAVKMAQQWRSIGGSESLKRCEFNLNQGNLIPDNGAALTVDFIVGAECAISHIEHLEIMIDINHEYSGDIDTRLVSPSTTWSQFTETRICGARERTTDQCGSYDQWRAASVRHLDESPLGTWRLELRDRQPGKTGALNEARLVLYGR
jgi:proprotein convertase subtilisin/kexin type 2